jgi:two-component system, OmpR family, response regulator RpaB
MSQLAETLRAEGYEVIEDSPEGEAGKPDAVLLSTESGPLPSLASCRKQPSLKTTPILVCLADPADMASALAGGADDCVAGEIRPAEVLARLACLLRRVREDSAALSVGGVHVDLRRSSANLGRGAVALTPKELGLFSYLATHAGTVVARGELLREVWGYCITESRTVDTHMAALRRKLEINPRRPEHLFTIRGRGYQFRT